MTTATIVVTSDDLTSLIAKLFIQRAKLIGIGSLVYPKRNSRQTSADMPEIDHTIVSNAGVKVLGLLRVDLIQLLMIVKHTEPKNPDASGFWVALSDPTFIREISPTLSILRGFEKSVLTRYNTDGVITSYTNQWFHHKSSSDKTAELMEPAYVMIYCNPFMHGFVKIQEGANVQSPAFIDQFTIVIDEELDLSGFPEKLLSLLASGTISIDKIDANVIRIFAEELRETFDNNAVLRECVIESLDSTAHRVLDLLWDPSIRTTCGFQ